MTDTIKIIAKRVGEDPVDETIEDSLEALQEFVGGYIEHVQIRPGLGLICNEEGLINGSHYNCRVEGGYFIFRDCLFIGSEPFEEDFDDVPITAEELLEEGLIRAYQ